MLVFINGSAHCYNNINFNEISATTLMSVPCIIRRSRNDQHYALICTTALFYILAPTCFGSSLPSSGSFLDPSELLEIQIKWVVYHIMCGYVACVLDCCGSVGTMTIQHTGHVTTHYMTYHPFDLYFQVTQKYLRSSLMMAGYFRNI